ncbi:MAG: hypothetical protein OMM_03448 [Candidatus Magnetoglobus multicellularis str. Araruama]|uniref:DUF3782 domain-containing protein n=1 Tax=Candidatus Magnetoglobus multicellularis str. Araruama TaxID=890399 RepID=A0A1V1P5R6_9BACT|nr:MAG: hypothetical protein OMM_03448 [Candidatus Magnetoglobus multicellularis str. Araruama]
MDKYASLAKQRDTELNEKLDKFASHAELRDAKLDARLDRLAGIVEKTDTKLDKKLKKIGKIVGGVTKNIGELAEEQFYKSCTKSMSIGDLTFHSIDRNLHRLANGIEDEFDIVLTNDNAALVVEVKHKFHPNDVTDVLKKLDNYKLLFPLYAKYSIYGAVAGMILPKKTIDLAKKYHLFVLTHEGNNLKLLHTPEHKSH